MIRNFSFFVLLFFQLPGVAQVSWQNVDSLYKPLPASVKIYYTNTPIDTAPFRAYYLIADLNNKRLDFITDTTSNRRATPAGFYLKNNQPLVIVNGTFFSFATNQNLNLVIKNKKLISYNVHAIEGKGKDTLTYGHPFSSALGISKKRKADIAWILTDSSKVRAYASQSSLQAIKDSFRHRSFEDYIDQTSIAGHLSTSPSFTKWKMKTAIGGGPVLIQNGDIKITNNEELKFAGKAILDKHPRTAMGYTADNKLIILVVEGRSPNSGGATLTQLAQLLKDLRCVEALNLDGGGSSCLLVNGKETIKPSDKEGQRAVSAVFMIRSK